MLPTLPSLISVILGQRFSPLLRCESTGPATIGRSCSEPITGSTSTSLLYLCCALLAAATEAAAAAAAATAAASTPKHNVAEYPELVSAEVDHALSAAVTLQGAAHLGCSCQQRQLQSLPGR